MCACVRDRPLDPSQVSPGVCVCVCAREEEGVCKRFRVRVGLFYLCRVFPGAWVYVYARV